jgi:hypothetical protein
MWLGERDDFDSIDRPGAGVVSTEARHDVAENSWRDSVER